MIPAKYWSPTKKLMMLGAMAGGKLVEDTATGNPLTFITDASKPLKSLLVPFLPVQSGSGDPSPQNIRPIVAWDGLKVWNGGKNLLNPAKYLFNTNTSMGLTFEVQSDGSVKVTGTTESSDFGPGLTERFQLPAGTYYGYRDEGDVYVTYRKSTAETGGETSGLISPFTLDGSEWVYCNIYVRNPGTFDTILHPQIARENTQTAYEPYKPITETDISFPSPVYGGTLDVVSGVLTVEWVLQSMKNMSWWSFSDELFQSNPQKDKYTQIMCDSFPVVAGNPSADMAIGSYTNGASYAETVIFKKEGIHNATDFLEWLNGLEYDPMIAYKVQTPQEITLTPEQITAIKGNNTIWSDANGSLTAVYLKKG